MEDSRQSITSYDLHRMHHCWQFKQRCQQAASNEQWQGTIHCLSCGSFTQSLKTLIQTRSVLSRQQTQTLLCPPADKPRHQAPSLTCICQCLVLSSALLCRATAALIHFLTGRFTSLHPVQFPSSRLHTCDCRGSLSQLHTLCNSLQRGERRGGKWGRKKEQVGTFFRGPVIFYLISQELLDYKSKVCQRKREDNKTQTGALHSSLHQEKSHPRAKPATFLGPLTLFRVSLYLRGLCCGIYKWNSDGNVFSARLWLLC